MKAMDIFAFVRLRSRCVSNLKSIVEILTLAVYAIQSDWPQIFSFIEIQNQSFFDYDTLELPAIYQHGIALMFQFRATENHCACAPHQGNSTRRSGSRCLWNKRSHLLVCAHQPDL